MQRINAALAGAGMLLGLATTAAAVPVKWEVDYTSSIGSVAVTGSFVYDADLNQYSSIDLTATDSGDVTNTTYSFLSPSDSGGSGIATFRNRESTDRTGEKKLLLDTFVPLTNAGGVISNSPSLSFLFFPTVCSDSNCFSASGWGASIDPSDSTLTGAPLPAAAIPLPAGLPLLLGGVAAFAVFRRRV